MDNLKKRILIVSLDGATLDVIQPLVAQGYMPNLGALISQGVATELESIAPPVTSPAWTSFMTGKHPSKHGIFDFSHFDPKTYTWSISNARHIKSKTLWRILSEKGKRVVVLNLPYTYPPDEVNGVIVSGWDAPFTDESFSYPPSIGRDILQNYPNYADNLWVSELEPLQSDAVFEEFTAKLKIGFEQQASIASDLLVKEEWDVFMVHFHQTDWMQHKLWGYIERACNEPHNHTTKIEATRNCYREFDRLLGKVFETSETWKPTTIVLSDHGFGRLMGSIYPNHYLKQWGYLKVKAESTGFLTSVKRSLRTSKLNSVRQVYRRLSEVKTKLLREDQSNHRMWTENANHVFGSRGSSWDWGTTKVATIYAYQMAFLFVNMIGRGSRGTVHAGAEYESLLSDLTHRFEALRHPIRGTRLIERAVRGVDLYPRPSAGIEVPDLVLIPVDGYGFGFTIADAPPETTNEGNHRPNGMVLLHGAPIRTPNGREFCPSLVDLAPTILNILDLPVPADMDGRVLQEVLALDRPIEYEEVDNSVVSNLDSHGAEDDELLVRRLRGLGYVE